jgi:hypothetical protein
MLTEPQTSWAASNVPDNRAFERVQLHVAGTLFDPRRDSTFACQVICLSAGGAGIECSMIFERDAALVLYIDGFGRFEGHAVPHSGGGAPTKFGLNFSLSKAKQARVLEMISIFLQDGVPGVTQMRHTKRVRANGLVKVRLADGQEMDAELIDISLDGVSLRTSMRPPLGEVVALGQTQGEVVRYHDGGIALRFIRDVSRENKGMEKGPLWQTL